MTIPSDETPSGSDADNRYCGNCGHAIDKLSQGRFCGKCGHDLKGGPAPEAHEARRSQSATRPGSNYQQEPVGDPDAEFSLFNSGGRSGRLVFLGLMVGIAIGYGIAATIMIAALVAILFVPLSWIAIVNYIRRPHDLGRSGWLILVMFVPIVNFLFFIYMLFAPGKPAGRRL
jgi:hypothetical protein